MTVFYTKMLPLATIILYDSLIWEKVADYSWYKKSGDKLDRFSSGIYLGSAFSGEDGNRIYEQVLTRIRNHNGDYRSLLNDLNAIIGVSPDYEAVVFTPVTGRENASGGLILDYGKVLKIPRDVNVAQPLEQIIFPKTAGQDNDVLLKELRMINGLYKQYIAPWVWIASKTRIPIVTDDFLNKIWIPLLGRWAAEIIKSLERTSIYQKLIDYPFRICFQIHCVGKNGLPWYLFNNMDAPIVIGEGKRVLDRGMVNVMYYKGTAI